MGEDYTTQYQFLDPVIDSEDDVLAIRATAIALYKEGKTLMEWGGEGNTNKRVFVAPVQQILAETRMCLKQMNPAVYGYPIRNSRPFFS